ncbi:hypothetical protein ACA910_013420 [Epithemia clementina (nom. ined.)]
MVDFYGIFSKIICPSLGAIMATCMFGAPIMDLRKALLKGKLGDLNPFPWMMMTGNCLGWIVYGYYLDPRDVFVVAANLPGFVISLWLNFGAAKLQYKELLEDIRERQAKEHLPKQDGLLSNGHGGLSNGHGGLSNGHHISNGSTPIENGGTSSPTEEEYQRQFLLLQTTKKKRRKQLEEERQYYNPENLVSVPQEVGLLRVLSVWIAVLVWVGWIGDSRQKAVNTIGVVVNLNLVFFYGAPLQTMQRVIFIDRHSNTIHRPTMYMSLACSSFSFLYGAAKVDPVIMLPNAIGVTLGLAQFLLCFCFPQKQTVADQLDEEIGTQLTPRQYDTVLVEVNAATS